MKYRPILFSGPMVRAILEGRKTQTRRILPEKEADWSRTLSSLGSNVVSRPQNGMSNRYGYPGDRLWVRETFAPHPDGGHVYRATDPDWRTTEGWAWKPSIHMPRAAARIILEITDVRIEPLQDISREDAIAEGVARNWSGPYEWWDYLDEKNQLSSPQESFSTLWKSVNGPESWELNPLVWVITFKRVEP